MPVCDVRGTGPSPGAAQVKIQGQNKEMLAAACQMFLGKSESEIAQIALETLEGHQRAIMAHMTVEVSGGTATPCRGDQRPPANTSAAPRRSTRTGRSSRSRFSTWPPPTSSTWASAWSATP